MARACEYFPPSHDDELTRLKERIAKMNAKIEELEAENKRLKNEKKKMYTKLQHDTIIDAMSRSHLQKLRATQRAMWLARADRAKERQNYESGCRSDGWVRRENMWLEVERLCRHKAEEYK